MTPRLRASHFVTATSFLLSLLACSSNDAAPDGGSKGGTPGPTATGGSLGKGGAQGLGGATKGAGGALGTGGVAVDGGLGSGGVTRDGGLGSGGVAVDGGSGSGGLAGPDAAPGTGGVAVLDGGLDGAGPGGTPGAGGKVATGGSTSGGGATGTGGTTGGGGAPGAGGSGTGGTTGAGEYGFTYRSPGTHTVSCSGPTGTQTADAPDMDWLCTFNQAGQKGYVYVRSTATGAQCLMSAVPTYTVDLAQISINGAVTPLTNAQYDWGGNHHNDAISFDYQNGHYRYYHSSIGFGFRSCQNMDCLITPTTDGCTSTRSLPEVCVQIQAGGTHDPLVDKFQKCPGDSH